MVCSSLRTKKRQEDTGHHTTDEFRLERNSCLVLNFSTCVPSVTNIVQQNLIQEQTASLTASSTPLISSLLANIARHRRRIKQNLLPSERTMIRTTLNRNVGFNDSDKNFCPVLYSRDLYLEQCKKHLLDGKGTYEYTEKPKDFILEDVTRRLKNLLNDRFRKESATKSLAQTLTRWADDSAQGLTKPHSSTGNSVLLAGKEHYSDIGRRCSALPLD